MKKKSSSVQSFFSFFLLTIFSLFCFFFLQAESITNGPLTDAETLYIKQRQLLYYRDEYGDRGENVTVDPSLVFENPRLKNAYIALQAWKQAILSDPLNLTANWVRSDVCSYTGVFCAFAPDNSSDRTVAGIDLNHGDIAGYLPEELGFLTDLALFHINSNRFCGTIPRKFKDLRILYELDVSNNRFAGKFPYVVLGLPKLKFLDLRFNEFEGKVRNCRHRKASDQYANKSINANMVEESEGNIVAMVSTMNIGMITELNMAVAVSEMAQYLYACQEHRSFRGEIIAIRRILDAHFYTISSMYVWNDELVNNLLKHPEVMISQNRVSIDTLVYLWKYWKDKILELVDYLCCNLGKNVGKHSTCEDFILNYFGVQKNY